MSQKILALWAVPRSTSTAFETMMRERGDYLVLDEPFGMYYYYSEEKKCDRYAGEGEIKESNNFQPLLQDIIDKSQSQKVFLKDMAYYVYDRADEAFLSHFDHTFLIRHPEKALRSLFARWPDFSKTEASYKEIDDLFEAAKKYTGKVPPLIDSDDLVNKPEATVKAYCEAVGIEFKPEALQWKPKVRSEINQWEGTWHGEVQSSQGFKPKEQKNYASIEDTPHLKQAYEYCLPYYEKLYEQRLRVE